MDSGELGKILRLQFSPVFQMLRWIIEHSSENCWTDHLVEPPVWQQLLHILWFTDRYLSLDPRERIHKPSFYEPGMECLDQWDWSNPPDRQQMLDYWQAVSDKCERRMEHFNLTSPDGKPHYAWTGPNLAHRLIYTLRHAHQHIGWINSRLSRAGERTVGWPCWDEESGSYVLCDLAGELPAETHLQLEPEPVPTS